MAYRLPKIATLFGAALLMLSCRLAFSQMAGLPSSSGFLWLSPENSNGPQLQPDQSEPSNSEATGPNKQNLPGPALIPSITANYVGRAAVIVDTTRMADFASGTFLPSAIPVKGEAFYEFGERATIQGSGSAVQIEAKSTAPSQADYSIRANIVLDATSGTPLNVASQVSVQYDRLLVGNTETAFADDDSVFQTLDLAGPNARITVLSPIGGGGQGRLCYFFYFSADKHRGLIGDLSLEQPIPEVQFTSGNTKATTFSTTSVTPDLITTLKYGDGEMTGPKNDQYDEFWHLQVGGVFRDIGLKNGNGSIDDSDFGWGVQLSGSIQLVSHPDCKYQDAAGFSVTYGEGIAHYVNDLHTVPTGQKGGNDAILVGNTLEVLPALAYYFGYVRSWNDYWQSTIGYSHVDLEPVVGQSPSAYHHGNYGVVNLMYHTSVNAPPVTSFFVGAEYLIGEKQELSGNSGIDNRCLLVVSFTK